MKRFYREVTLGEVPGGWQVLLDGRGVKTAMAAPQVVPARALAEALAAEWAAQGDEIDVHAFPVRDLADYAIDIAGPSRATVVAALLRFAETDTLCYRAEPEEALFARQENVWEPLIRAAESRLEVRFVRVSGVLHRPQPAASLARLEAVLASLDPFTLAALHTLTSLSASLIVGLAALEPGADAEALWRAANLEEDWQAELWGWDADAEALRERRFGLFAGAMGFARLST